MHFDRIDKTFKIHKMVTHSLYVLIDNQMKKEVEMAQNLQDAIERTAVGELVPVHFGKVDVKTDVVFEFPGGWSIKMPILPGQSLNLKKGAGTTPIITINMKPSDDEFSARKTK